MIEILVLGFLKGVCFATVFDFLREVIGKKFYVAVGVFFALALFIALEIGGISFAMQLYNSFFSWESLAFFIGLFPGEVVGKALGKMAKGEG